MSSAKNVVARYLTEREVRLAARFRPGDEVKVKPSHGFKEWHGDTGVIEKIIPINKAYVQLKENGRQIFDLDDLEQRSRSRAGTRRKWTADR